MGLWRALSALNEPPRDFQIGHAAASSGRPEWSLQSRRGALIPIALVGPELVYSTNVFRQSSVRVRKGNVSTSRSSERGSRTRRSHQNARIELEGRARRLMEQAAKRRPRLFHDIDAGRVEASLRYFAPESLGCLFGDALLCRVFHHRVVFTKMLQTSGFDADIPGDPPARRQVRSPSLKQA
jgi:hypothetical protein